MAKIIKHPEVIQYLERKITNISNGIEAPFENVERTQNKAFNKFMDKADNLFNNHEEQQKIIKETFLLNKALQENPEYMDLSKQINEMQPKTLAQIEDYREKTNKLLKFIKESGANTMHDNMKIAFDLMLDIAEKGNHSKIDTII